MPRDDGPVRPLSGAPGDGADGRDAPTNGQEDATVDLPEGIAQYPSGQAEGDDDRLIGTTCSHYEITAKLGEGGMGQVYLARDTQLERKVALKVLPADLAENPERLKRLKREARSLAALDHPNIVPVYSFENVDGLQFLTMAFIEGESLEEKIPTEGFPLERLLDLAVPLADALRAAHEHGIVHRDLKPANVMVDHDGRLRVLDFGLAKRDLGISGDLGEAPTRGMTDQMTQEGTILGTYPYMSPEQAEGRAVDPRSDLFSFGVMLYEMACGHRPFKGNTGISLISSILRDPHRSITEEKPDLPTRLGKILDRCLEKDPDQRYPTAEFLRDDLDELRRTVAAGTTQAPALADPLSPELATGIDSAQTAPPVGLVITRRHVLRLGVAIGVLAVAGVAIWRPWITTEKVQSLAVLPFENSLQDEETEYLCDGIAESLIRQVSRLPTVRVSPLSAVLNYKGQTVDPGDVGRQLDVDTVLAGSLSHRDGRLKVTARLLDSSSGAELWTNTYDRAATELLDVQDEIAGAILQDGFGVESITKEQLDLVRPPTIDGEAYDLYLQARYLTRRGTEDEYLQARELLQRALVRDPGFAHAYLMLAGIHAAMVIDGYLRPTDGWAQANRFMRQALTLDPDVPDVHAITHSIAFFFDWDWEGAERERQLAMQTPVGEFDPDLWRVYSFYLLALDRPTEALELARRSRELDPLSIGLAMLEADYLVRVGQLDDAVALYRRTIEVEPDNPEQYFGLAEALYQQGRFDEAIEARRQAHQVAGDDVMAEKFAAASGEEGYNGADRAWVQVQLLWIEAREPWGYVSPLDFARAYSQLGEEEKAFEYLDKAFVDRSPGLVFLNIDRAWDNIREDPRFSGAVKRVGLPTPN
jgi:TolB-like protein/Tfp pilus assembly protein PilF/predicted Ser/Thr protein kinase